MADEFILLWKQNKLINYVITKRRKWISAIKDVRDKCVFFVIDPRLIQTSMEYDRWINMTLRQS